MVATRRAHRKSRSGCAECKRRRIKCGEQKPSCLHCNRHHKSCVYPPQDVTVRNHSPSSETETRSLLSPPSASPSTSDVSIAQFGTPCSTSEEESLGEAFTLDDLALLHHWALFTSVSLANTHQGELWQTLIPHVGFRHRYMMHSILSLTALHCAYLNPVHKKEYILAAARHHSASLDGFTQDMGAISADNSDALFINAILTFFYAFLTFGQLSDDNDLDPDRAARTSRVLGADWIPLARGIRVVLEPVYELVREGPIRSMLCLGNWDELRVDDFACADECDEQMRNLQEIWSHDEHAKTYGEALSLLRKCRLWIIQSNDATAHDALGWGHGRTWAGPFVWLSLVPEQYIVLLQQRQPPALIMFAWFGALLHGLDRYWWMQGCGKTIVDVVNECLGPYWDPWTWMPKDLVESG